MAVVVVDGGAGSDPVRLRALLFRRAAAARAAGDLGAERFLLDAAALLAPGAPAPAPAVLALVARAALDGELL